ncbi:putative dehydrogenase [Mycetocola sp. CAN_C7]|uniref:Gfo/Idh/MocA family protein n=1 Tax=Mycetocola sp. CAN_C7 TaxID=2787724 RepID=UPI0018C8D7FD
MSRKAALKVAIASFAHTHAASYVSVLARVPDVDVRASDPHGADAPDSALRGAELAERLGVDYVDTYDELFAWEPDAVIVATENSRHRALVERAAREGVHVLCEKPLATTVADGEAMVEACRAAGVILMIAYPVRFAPGFAVMRDHLDSGRLGEMFAINGTNNGKLPREHREWFTDRQLAGGGALVDHVVHCADLIDALTGGLRAETVNAASNQILHAKAGLDVETGGLVTVRYPGGLIATIDCSWSHPSTSATWGGLTLQATGTKGSVEIAPFAEHVSGLGDDGEIFLGFGTDLNALLLAEFLDAVRTSGRPVAGQPPRVTPQPDGDVGLRTLEIMEAALRSAELRQPVALER